MNIKALPTEQRNPDTVAIDEVSTIEMLRMINNEDKKVAFCVERHLGEMPPPGNLPPAGASSTAARAPPAAWASWTPPNAPPPMAWQRTGWCR